MPDLASPEFRRDQLSGQTVLIAPSRSNRPSAFPNRRQSSPVSPVDCPFCPHNESMTPPEIARIGTGRPGEVGWHVRVVPNKYPALTADAHEVVILSPSHDRSLGELTAQETCGVFMVLRDRLGYQLESGRAYAQALINHRPEAGASIEHPHAQVMALEFVPPKVSTLWANVTPGEPAPESADLNIGEGEVDIWCPWASEHPYEIAIAHRDAGPMFQDATDEVVRHVTRAAVDALARLSDLLDDPPYNLVLHSAPPSLGDAQGRWHIRIMPRLSVQAGFEQATGIMVNVVDPAQAAAELREVGAASAR